MRQQRLLILSALLIALTALGAFLYGISPGWNEMIDWRSIVFEAAMFLFVFSWNVTVLPYWKSSKILCLGSLLFLAGAFTNVHDELFIQPYWVNMFLEDPAQALGAGLIGLGIWFWAKEKEHLLDQLQRERDFEASLIPKLSHDLRAPLTNLCGMTSVAEEDPKFLEDPKRRQEYLEVMWRGAKEMCLLIDNILESHRLKSGAVELKPGTVSLAPLLDDTCKDFYYQTKKKEITIVKDCPDEGLKFEADQLKVMRIVQNLLANAIRFSPQGGKITLRARAENGGITVRVADEGPGVDAEQISVIMEDAPRAKKGEPGGDNKGYGIGLKVVKEFVHLHRGRFWVEPNSPRGAQFCFTLPLRQNLKSLDCLRL
jgi:signal transduction histidine kinase